MEPRPPDSVSRIHWRRAIACSLCAIATAWPVAGADRDAREDEAPVAYPDRHTPVSEVTFVAFDTETTGFSPVKDRIVELGAVKFRGGEVLAGKSWLVNPQRSIPYWAKRVHGINEEMVADQPLFKEIYPEFKAFVEGSVLIAHNARFDISFIREEIRRRGFEAPENRVIDSLALFRAWFPGADSYSLAGLMHHLEMTGATLHRANADSMQIYRIIGKADSEGKVPETLGALEKAAGGALKF